MLIYAMRRDVWGGGLGQGLERGEGRGRGSGHPGRRRARPPPPPRRAPTARLSQRGSPAAAPPPPWRRCRRSAPSLHHSGSGSRGPSAKTFKLETSREAAPEPRDAAPPPEARRPACEPGTSAASRPRQIGAPDPTAEPEATAPPPGSDVPRDLGPSTTPEAAVPAVHGTHPRPPTERQGRTSPGAGVLRLTRRALRSGSWGTAPPAGLRALPVWRVHSGQVCLLFLGTPPPPGAVPKFLSPMSM